MAPIIAGSIPDIIYGSLKLVQTPCGQPLTTAELVDDTTLYEISDLLEPNVTIKPNFVVNRIEWNYPTSFINLEFFSPGEEEPYAVVSGPSQQTYLGSLCKGWKSNDKNWHINTTNPAPENLFKCSHSFLKVTLNNSTE